MLVQMFGSMHRDQMERIREELDQLRDLTKEFHSLKIGLTARSQTQIQAHQSTLPRRHGLRRPDEYPGVNDNDMADAMIRPATARPGSAPARTEGLSLEGIGRLATFCPRFRSILRVPNAPAAAEAQPRTGSPLVRIVTSSSGSINEWRRYSKSVKRAGKNLEAPAWSLVTDCIRLRRNCKTR